MPAHKKPVFSKRAFWSDDLTALDVDTHAAYIIARVFDAGTFADMQEAIRYYGQVRIRSALTEAIDLQSSTIAYAALWFGLTPADFAATIRQQINPEPYTNSF